MRWGPADVARFAHGAGFRGRDWTTAVAVALATSDGDDQWQFDPPGAREFWRIGLWGVRPYDAGSVAVFGELTDPNVNAAAAFGLVAARGGWSWAPAFVNGSYAPFLAGAGDVTAPGATTDYPAGATPSAATAGALRYAADAGRRAVGSLLDGARALGQLGR